MSDYRVVLEIGRQSPTIVTLTGADGLNIDSLPTPGIDILAGSAADASFSFTVPAHNLPNLLLPGSKATLFYGEYQLCRCEVKGDTIDPNNGTISVTAGPQRYASTLTFPPALIGDRVGNARRFPNVSPDALGETVPVLYGYIQDSPLIKLDDQEVEADPPTPVRFLIAGHRIASTEIVVVDGDGLPVGTYPVETALDGLGGIYSFVTIGSDAQPDSGFASTVAGYLSNTGGPVHKLGDVLESMWRNYGQGFDLDWTRITKARTRLNRFSVGLRFDQQLTKVSLVEVVESRIAGQFPVVFGAPTGQYGWDAATWPLPTDLPERALVFEQNAWDSSEVTKPELDSIVNRASITYQRSGRTDRDSEFRYLDGTTSEACRVSIGKWGPSPESQLSFPDVSGLNSDDFGQAWAVAEELIKRQGDLHQSITYTTNDVTWLSTPLNTLISVTDMRPTLRWSNRRALLQGRSLGEDGSVSLKVLLID